MYLSHPKCNTPTCLKSHDWKSDLFTLHKRCSACPHTLTWAPDDLQLANLSDDHLMHMFQEQQDKFHLILLVYWDEIQLNSPFDYDYKELDFLVHVNHRPYIGVQSCCRLFSYY